ncbi:MAG TPA: phospholipase D family protein [Steroidobacteraceae bacterium]|nr:phospholipase D family protein [Steroidobacteraceae bacterium]
MSAFRLLADGTEAFVVRMHSARMAVRSIDVQTYLWHADLTGKFLAHQLLESADRGVKVRLLVDDLDARAKNAHFAALAAHPHIEVRVFNPFASRNGTLNLVSESARNFERINRRMHNKTWIADNRLAIVGGRNLGDEYFGASDEVNFVDLDFGMVGPVVRDASESFDRYWNSPSAYPLELLDADAVDAGVLKKLRAGLARHARESAGSRYALALREDPAIARLIAGDWPMEWSDTYRFIADDPQKITMKKRDANRAAVSAVLLPAMRDARSALDIVSPYFVPGDKGSTGLVNTVHAGSQVRILTNSLAANDVAAVHGGYSRFRPKLLKGGVQLWELKPLSIGETDSSLFGSSGASLHTKALSIDRRTLFVGSYNLDPRSTWLNCEQGVLVESPALVTQFREIFETQTAGSHSWRVTRVRGELKWTDDKGESTVEPQTTFSQRMQAWFARTLRLDAQL